MNVQLRYFPVPENFWIFTMSPFTVHFGATWKSPYRSIDPKCLVNLILWITNLFSKLPQMLPKKAKMAFWRLSVGGTLIRTREFCSPGLSLVAKPFSRPWCISKNIFWRSKFEKNWVLVLPIGFKDKIKIEKLSIPRHEKLHLPQL